MSRPANPHITEAQRGALADQIRRIGILSAEDAAHPSAGISEWRLFNLRTFSDFLNMLETLGWIEAEEFQQLHEALVRAVEGGGADDVEGV